MEHTGLGHGHIQTKVKEQRRLTIELWYVGRSCIEGCPDDLSH